MNLKPAISNSAVGQAFSRQVGTSSRNFPVPCFSVGGTPRHQTPNPRPHSAFSLVEVLIVITLLALIVLALMDVFSSTQRAFRASVTQVDVLEGSRAAMELITADLRKMTAGGGSTNQPRDVNLSVVANGFAYAAPTYTTATYTPLVQFLPGSTGINGNRVNLLEYFFILGRENNRWTGTGYAVDTTSSSPLYPLYRYHSEISVTNPPHMLFTNFLAEVRDGQWTNMSHLVDGVVHLVVRPYDLNGAWLTNGNTALMTHPQDVLVYGSYQGEWNLDFAGAALPASVELQMAVMEDRVLARAESLPNNLPALPPGDRRTIYLSNQSGTVHVFRQQVSIPNVDRSVYP
ncbi:MAG TPA: prepilin-type N-terminal cleavage/methylation domain-containing protein [Candidatus Acidoferrales bacterium]|nr:prepilin-type N-terminal cleavage/methylation domain-containing protein [Candidatus Acidoferrales bacterium]